MVLNQLTSSPQSDSLMADEADEAEGSGEGSGTVGDGSSPSGWNGDDDDDDVDSSGYGSGENPITTQSPGAIDHDGDYYFFFSKGTIPRSEFCVENLI